MKKIVVSLFLGAALFANEAQMPQMSGMEAMIFNQIKATLPMQENMLASLQKAKPCFSKANSKEEALVCSKEIYGSLNGLNDDEVAGLQKVKADESFVWNPNEKQNLLKDITESINDLTKNIACIKGAKEFKALDACMQKE